MVTCDVIYELSTKPLHDPRSNQLQMGKHPFIACHDKLNILKSIDCFTNNNNIFLYLKTSQLFGPVNELKTAGTLARPLFQESIL